MQLFFLPLITFNIRTLKLYTSDFSKKFLSMAYSGDIYPLQPIMEGIF
jgi:hypothetical protein